MRIGAVNWASALRPLRLQQAGGNRDAVGAWVEVDLGDRVICKALTVRGGHASGHLGWVHFGLGELDKAKTVRVRVQWPHAECGPWSAVMPDAFYRIDPERGVVEVKLPRASTTVRHKTVCFARFLSAACIAPTQAQIVPSQSAQPQSVYTANVATMPRMMFPTASAEN